MERNDTISGILAFIGYLVMIAGLLIGWFFANLGGGFFFFILYTLLGVAFGMLFLGLAFILNKLDNLAEVVMEQKSLVQQAPVIKLEKE